MADEAGESSLLDRNSSTSSGVTFMKGERPLPLERRNETTLQHLRFRLTSRWSIEEAVADGLAAQLDSFHSGSSDLMGGSGVTGLVLQEDGPQPNLHVHVVWPESLPEQERTRAVNKLLGSFAHLVVERFAKAPLGTTLHFTVQDEYIATIGRGTEFHHVGVLGSSGLSQLRSTLLDGSRTIAEHPDESREIYELILELPDVPNDQQDALVEQIHKRIAGIERRS